MKKLLYLLAILLSVSVSAQIDVRSRAPLASPTFTGTPKAPTPLLSEYSTRLATTEFVQDISQKAQISNFANLFKIGDSYTVGTLGPTSVAKSFAATVNEFCGTIENNIAVSGTGLFTAAGAAYTSISANNVHPALVLIGFNDIRKIGDGTAALEKIKSGHRAILANHFLASAVAANNVAVTTSGTWTTLTAGTFKDKASANLSGLPRTSSVSGSTLTWAFSGPTLVIGCWGSDVSQNDDGRFTVTIDGTLYQTYNPAGKNIYSAGYDGASGRVQNAVVITGLNGGSHTVVVTTLDNKPTPIDYFGTLLSQPRCAPVLVGGIPYMNSAGYAFYGSPVITQSSMDLGTAAIQSVIAEFANYPVYYFNPNKYFNVSTDMYTDNVHWNDLGNAHLAKAVIEKISKLPNPYLNSPLTFLARGFTSTAIPILRSQNDVGTNVQLVTYPSGQSTSGLIGPSVSYVGSSATSLLIGSQASSSTVTFLAGGTAVSNAVGLFNSNGRWRLGDNTTPTATLHLKTHTASANSAPLKFDMAAGPTYMTTPEDGAIEYTNNNLYFTNGSTRYALAKTVTAVSILDFPSTAAGAFSDLTISVAGCVSGDAVMIGIPNGSMSGGGIFFGWVSANNTVTIRFLNTTGSAIDPASGTFRAVVPKY